MRRSFNFLCLTISLAWLVGSGCKGPSQYRHSTGLSAAEVRAQSGGVLAEVAAPLPASPALLDYTAHAAAQNPEVRAAYHRWLTAMEQVPQARALPDPRFTFTEFLQEVETRVGPQRHKLGISQTLPWFGTLALREQAARSAVLAALKEAHAVQQQIIYEVSDVYADMYFLEQRQRQVADNLKLLMLLEPVIRSKVRAGAGQADLIRVQVEIGTMEDRLASVKDQRRVVATRLNTLLDRPDNAALSWPLTLAASPFPDGNGVIDQAGVTANPELLALDERIGQRATELELARKKRYPDVTVGLEFIDTGSARTGHPSNNGTDPVMLMFGVNLPVWGEKNDAREAQAAARQMTARDMYASKENRLRAALEVARYNYRDAGRKIELYSATLIPRARQSYAVLRRSYQDGKADFTAVIDAVRMLFALELEYERAFTERFRHTAKIGKLTGRLTADKKPIAERDKQDGKINAERTDQ